MLDGPRLPPASGRLRQLVVFLHGYGADGHDLVDIGRDWGRVLPDAAFVAPHAPEPCGGAPFGRQWFDLTFRDPHERWRGVTHAAPTLDRFLTDEIDRFGLAPADVALVGFSQGAMMALHVGLRRPERIGAVLGYSGLLVLDHARGVEGLRADIRSIPPVLLVHGSEDDVIPSEALSFSRDALAGAAIPCRWHLCQGLGHGIDEAGLRHGAAFLEAHLTRRAGEAAPQ